jgi:hypothetical protein
MMLEGLNIHSCLLEWKLPLSMPLPAGVALAIFVGWQRRESWCA